MAMLGGSAVATLILKVAGFTKQTTLNYYKASKEMDSFKLRLIDLKCQLEHWASVLTKYNMENDPEIRSLLEHASQLLDEEEAKMKELQSNWIQRSWKKLLYPETLTDAIEKVISALKRLPQRLAERQKETEQLEKNAFNRVARLPFAPDKKYVEFKTTMAAVQTALESETTGPVVTLFGGPGQGKTSMARHLALFYQNGSFAINTPDVPEEALSAQNLVSKRFPRDGFFHCCGLLSKDAFSDPNPLANAGDKMLPVQNLLSKRFPNGVFFYSCRRTAKDILDELWRDLGYQLSPPTTEAGQDQASSSNLVQQSWTNESSLRKELMKRLSSQKVLIVLDDVREPKLIEDLLFPGRWVKYLITTQKSQLWNDANCVAIQIQSPTSDEAYQILRNHVHGFPTPVPPELQKTIDALIKQAAHSPLVLANMAENVRSKHASDLEEWKFLKTYVERLINQKDVHLSTVLFGRTYSKLTMQASIMMAMDSFTRMEQTLLLLASICESESIPEVVFKIFFKRIENSLYWFSKYSENLHMNTFIQIERKTVPWSTVPEKSWSLHPLRQEVISLIKKEEVASLVAKLLECNIEDEIIIALLVLYGQKPWCDQAANKVMSSRGQCSNNTHYWKSGSLQLSTIKPFVSLIQADGEEGWEKTSYHLVGKVLYKYLFSGELDDNSISMLFAMQKTTSPTLVALTKMATLKGKPIFTKDHPKTIRCLLNFIECVEPNLAQDASWLLGHFSFEGLEDQIEHQSFPNYVMERLTSLLAKDVRTDTQKYVACALARMASKVVQNRIKIGSFPNTIGQLVALLAQGESPDAQEWATLALGTMASDVLQNRINIGLFPNAIERLVALLAEHVSPNTQKWAALALGNVAFEVIENQSKIGSLPGAIERLVALLGEHVSLDTQKWATLALGNMAFEVVENQVNIGLSSSAIERLVALLAKEESPDTQKWAALALANMASKVAENQIKIGLFPNAIERLVVLLAKEESPDAQKWGACALAHIAVEVFHNRITIGLFPCAIERLVALLGEHVNQDTQKWAALALVNMAFEVVENKKKIASIPGAIERLVVLLAKEESPDAQKLATFELGNMASKVVES